MNTRVQARGRCTSNLLILDEVHTNLDGEGIERMVALLRRLPHAHVLLVGQANTDLDRSGGPSHRSGEARQRVVHTAQPVLTAEAVHSRHPVIVIMSGESDCRLV